MVRRLVVTGIIVFGGLCFAACSHETATSPRDSAPPVPESVGAGNLAWATTRPPTVAVSAQGTVYVVWSGKGQRNAPRPAGLPMISEEYTFISRLPEFSSVPGISVRRDSRWSKPGLLVEGQKDCSPLHAWCVGETLNLIVVGESDDRCYHLELQPDAEAWHLKASLPFSFSQYCARRTNGEQVHIAFSKGMFVHYVYFDGKEWSEALAIEASRNETSSVTRPRLAVDDDGVAHVMWWTADREGFDVHGYAVVSGGEVMAEPVNFTESPIESDEFDLGFLPGGRLFLAYKARIAESDPNATKLHIRCRDSGAWTEPNQIEGTADVLFGDVYTAWSKDATFVSWLVREDLPIGGGILSTGFRRCSTFDTNEWSESRWMAASPARGGDLIPAGPIWMGMCIDTHDRLHATWQGGSYALVADLSRGKSAEGGAEQATPDD